MPVGLQITFDTSQLETWTAQAKKMLDRNLRSAIDTSATAARRAAIIAIAKDSDVPASRFRKGTPLVSRSRPGKLVATWSISGRGTGNMIRPEGGSAVPAKIPRLSKYVAATFRNTGGGSNPLVLGRAFVISGKSGNRLVVERFGPGKGDWKPVYAEGPRTAMSQERSVPRRVWERTALDRLSAAVPAAVEKALHLATADPIGVSSVIHDGDRT